MLGKKLNYSVHTTIVSEWTFVWLTDYYKLINQIDVHQTFELLRIIYIQVYDYRIQKCFI